MKINISDFKKQNKLELNFSVSTRSLNLRNDESFQFINQVHFLGTAEKIGTKVHVTGKIDVEIKAICSRCLAEYKSDFNIKFSILYLSRSGQTRIDEAQEAYCQGNIIILDKEVRDVIYLNMPLKLICNPKCKGLCQICGKDRNIADCKCGVEKTELDSELREGVNLGQLIKKSLKGG
ncbi:DUF177 domain-containing protein [Candidatus Dependentiae bacterium]|nr:DUF177 domain-containing protein [Candidatus Dependentiae bacterium]